MPTAAAVGARRHTVSAHLCGQVADGELGQDDLCARFDTLVELPIDDLPLRVHDRLVLCRVRDAHLGVRRGG